MKPHPRVERDQAVADRAVAESASGHQPIKGPADVMPDVMPGLRHAIGRDTLAPVIFSRDTSLEADRVLVELLRRATIGRKWIMVDQQCELVRSLARSGLRTRYPEADAAEIEARFCDLILGPDLGPRVLAAKRARESRGGEGLGRGSH
jgi:hypothetical protein